MSRLLRFLRAVRASDPGAHVTMAFGQQLDEALARHDGVVLHAATLERALDERKPARRAAAGSRRPRAKRATSPPGPTPC